MALRYALLAHTVNGETHFDLMLELKESETLRTWRLAERLDSDGATCTAEALPPHRSIYLDYQGPISDGRGEVKRVESGTWEGEGSRLTLTPDIGASYALEIRDGQARRG